MSFATIDIGAPSERQWLNVIDDHDDHNINIDNLDVSIQSSPLSQQQQNHRAPKFMKVFVIVGICSISYAYSSFLSGVRFDHYRMTQVLAKGSWYESSFLTDDSSIEENAYVPYPSIQDSSTVNVSFAEFEINHHCNGILGKISEEDYKLTIAEYVHKNVPRGTIKGKDVKHLEFAYSNVREMVSRCNRFPTTQQRVKVYMSNWYIPPCDDSARVRYLYSDLSDDNVTVLAREISLHDGDDSMLFDDDDVIYPNLQQRVFEMNSHFNESNILESFDEVHYLDRQIFLECKHTYCKDTVRYLLPSLDRLLNNSTGTVTENNTNIPIFYQFGDIFESTGTLKHMMKNENERSVRYPRIPIIQKVRNSKSPKDLQFETDDTAISCFTKGARRATAKSNGFHYSHPLGTVQMEPIVYKIKTYRHYGPVYKVADLDTIPWIEKKNVAIFRGALTGSYGNKYKPEEIEELAIHERCRLLPRCWFTLTHAKSSLVDAKLTEPYFEGKGIPRYMNMLGKGSGKITFDSYGNKMGMDELLQYKVLIMLEGNDISSGLKWALFSNSIVMMPEPTLTSWSMEEMLQPWVHYVPIDLYKSSDGNTIVTDAEEKMQWILDNEEKALEIVKASTLWIADLVLHPDVARDEKEIFDEIAMRYISHFVQTTDDDF